jgi:prophage regulatory protein
MIPRIIRLPEVMAATGESRSTIYKRISDGKFPKPVKLGPKSVGWVEEEIAAYNEARIAARDTGQRMTVPTTPTDIFAAMIPNTRRARR